MDNNSLINEKSEKIKSLQEEINLLNRELRELRNVSFASRVSVKPRNYTHSKDVWLNFLALAKEIHRASAKRRGMRTLPRITELNKVQQQLSIDMLNEIIPIYNKYWDIAQGNIYPSDPFYELGQLKFDK